MPRVRAEEQRELELIAGAVKELFANRGCMTGVSLARYWMVEHLRRVTGLDVNFRHIYGDFRKGVVTLEPFFDDWDAYDDISVSCIKGKRLRIQDVPAVYVAD